MAFLAAPAPFDLELTTERFRAFGVDDATVWHEGGLHRVIGGREVRIEAAPGGVQVDPLDREIEHVVGVLLGVGFDLGSFYAWAAADEVLGPATRRLAGFRPTLAPDPFEMLVGSITAQQVSLFAAVAIRNRMIERFGRKVGHVWEFPSRSALAGAEEDELLAVGFSRRKAEYTVALARSVLDLDRLAALPDDEVKRAIVSQRGLGEWTAEWFLARHLARPHAWPWGDLALRKAVADLYGGLGVKEARERFHPFENLSAHYLLLAHRNP